MNKKVYITPAMEEMNIETVEMLAMSENEVLVSDKVTTDDAYMGRGRRSSWGDLWGSEE
ncbi:MAG: hypothetical protein IJE15_04245 [Bacteroidaceae bacterium]|nr:hypothetical protein [Bacteroidaceae bacterium]